MRAAISEPGAGSRLEGVRARREELHGALVALERALARPAARPEWLSGVAAAMADLRRALDDHTERAEGAEGLFEQVLADAPRLAGSIETHRRAHSELSRAVRRGLDVVETTIGADQPPVEEIRRTLIGLLGRLARHRQLGADLLYEAYQVDIGTGPG